MGSLLRWGVLFLGAVLVYDAFNSATPDPNGMTREVSLSEFVSYAQAEKLNEVTFVDSYTVVGSLKRTEQNKVTKIKAVADTSNPKVFELLEKNKIVPSYKKPEKPSALLGIFVSLLPLLLFLGAIYVLFKKQNTGGSSSSSGSSGSMFFGRSNAKRLTSNSSGTTFGDVAGADEAKEELQEVVDFLKNPDKYKKLGGKVPKGVLLQGPPGTGKTLLARAVAGEANAPFLFMSGSEFVEMFVGVGASRVRDLFEQAKRNTPSVIFIDEIDAVGKQRGVGFGGGNDEREQTLNQLLVEMDGVQPNGGIVVIAATNRSDVLDKALLRPGRFDRIVTVENPDVKGREAILKVHTREVPLDKKVDLRTVAKGTTGLSGAELANLINEAAIVAAKKDKSQVDMDDIEYARDKILMGAEKKSRVFSDKEKKVTAYHEAGHAIVGKLLSNVDPIHKVTIIPRGRALGITQTLPEEERLSMTKGRAEDMIAFLMGGRAAEELIFNQYTTGASNDIERATELARRMVVEWGMSSSLGPLNYSIKQDTQAERSKKHSEKISEAIDKEIKAIVELNYNKAKNMLIIKKNALEEMAKVLLEKETIDGQEVNRIVGLK